jgi:4-aminobutyrate aminotransferase/(S)-3-amino-2-methylpropionate transaminase
VADEVQTGFGRTARMFAMEHFDVEPDLMIVAKSIAGGLPLSGVVGRAEIMDDPHYGAIGGTFIGNPVALAAACAVLDVFAEEQLVARAELLGDALRARMLAWQSRWPQIGDVRGLGAMVAIELVEHPETKQPAPDFTEAVIDEALRRGLLLLKAGVNGNCIRVLCPLTTSESELDDGLRAWEEALAAVLG